jgi:hypothetical protein
MLGKLVGAAVAGPAVALGLVMAGAAGAGGAGGGVGGGGPSPGEVGAVEAAAVGAAAGRAVADIPGAMLVLYREAPARECPGLSWTVLAGIGRVETDHGRDTAVSSAGAEGPMQFLPATFLEYGVDADGGDSPDISDPADAVLSAARLLCADGAADLSRLPAAIYAYNHSWTYVTEVLGWADTYAATYPG